jgi:hypothetical protein
MRAAAALVAAVAVLPACSSDEGERGAILIASLAHLGKELKEPRLPVCAILSERQPLAQRSWAFAQGAPPSGFGDLVGPVVAKGPLSLEPLESKLPEPWFVEDRAGEICFQLTRPVIRDTRAVVTGAFGNGGADDLSRTWNFWLRREGGRWRVVETTKGHYDI